MLQEWKKLIKSPKKIFFRGIADVIRSQDTYASEREFRKCDPFLFSIVTVRK